MIMINFGELKFLGAEKLVYNMVSNLNIIFYLIVYMVLHKN